MKLISILFSIREFDTYLLGIDTSEKKNQERYECCDQHNATIDVMYITHGVVHNGRLVHLET